MFAKIKLQGDGYPILIRRCGMATSSILKKFVVKDVEAFERMKKDLDTPKESKAIPESPSLVRGRKKLNIFVFR